tara:strand:+ start:276 stop:590 length:315 start_codon:yes stop_codon:yes gene_type:complete
MNLDLNTIETINEVKSNKATIVDIFNLTKKQFSLILVYFEKKSNLLKRDVNFNARYSVRVIDNNPMMVVKDLDKSDDDESNGVMVSNKFGNALEYARLDGQIEI